MSAAPSFASMSRSPAGAARRRRILLTAALIVLACLWLLPAVWVGVTSLKLTENIIRVPPEWIPWPATLAHYGEVLFSSSRTARIGRAFVNSVIVSVGTVVLVLITSAMASGIRGLGKLITAASGQREADLAREVGVPPWKLKSMRSQARGWDQGSLASALKAIAMADADVKGAADDASYSLERAVLSVSRLRH